MLFCDATKHARSFGCGKFRSWSPPISLAPFSASPFSWFLTFGKVKMVGSQQGKLSCGITPQNRAFKKAKFHNFHHVFAPDGIGNVSVFRESKKQAHNNIVVGAKLTPNRRSWPTNLPGWRAPCLTTSHGDSFGSRHLKDGPLLRVTVASKEPVLRGKSAVNCFRPQFVGTRWDQQRRRE